jgi:ubiquinone/menaquinone biosynthesis C-methylase UbiE
VAIFFRLLYNEFYWFYDTVAAVVSGGKWNTWVYSIIELVDPVATLELGFGTGHLQTELLQQMHPVFGLDLSRFMTRKTKKRIIKNGLRLLLMQADSRSVPLADNSFHQVICTFPSDYIFQPQTLSEIHRVLKHSGKLIILLAVQITGKTLKYKALNLLYRITGQSPNFSEEALQSIVATFEHHSFQVQSSQICEDFYSLLFLTAVKSEA